MALDSRIGASSPAFRRSAYLRRFVPALWCSAIFLAVLVPYVAAIQGAPAGSFFRGGSLRPSEDEAQYLSAVRFGAAGDWLWHDPFAVHSPGPILMYPTYLFWGHLGALLHIDVRASYILGNAFYVLVLYDAIWGLAGVYLSGCGRVAGLRHSRFVPAGSTGLTPCAPHLVEHPSRSPGWACRMSAASV